MLEHDIFLYNMVRKNISLEKINGDADSNPGSFREFYHQTDRQISRLNGHHLTILKSVLVLEDFCLIAAAAVINYAPQFSNRINDLTAASHMIMAVGLVSPLVGLNFFLNNQNEINRLRKDIYNHYWDSLPPARRNLLVNQWFEK